MSNTSPISLRVASKTRHFEMAGDSSYYYSSQLIANLAFLKTLSKLGQQLGWPSKAPLSAPPLNQGSAFLAKANSSFASSLVPSPLVNLKATPGKEWLSANLKLVEKLARSQQFLNSKGIGLLGKAIGSSGRLDPLYLLDGATITSSPTDRPMGGDLTLRTICDKPTNIMSENKISYKISKPGHTIEQTKTTASPLTTLIHCPKATPNYGKGGRKAGGTIQPFGYSSLNYLSQLAKFDSCCPKIAKPLYRTNLYSKLSEKSNITPLSRQLNPGQLHLDAGHPFLARKDYRQAFKTPTGLPFYLTALGLITHGQALRSSLAITPIRSGSLPGNLLITDFQKILRVTSSSGLGLVSLNPKLFISRNHKTVNLDFFFRVPSKLAEARPSQTLPYHTTYLSSEQAVRSQGPGRIRSSYASARWL